MSSMAMCRRCGHSLYEHTNQGCGHKLAHDGSTCTCTQQVVRATAETHSPLFCPKCEHGHEQGHVCQGWLVMDNTAAMCGCNEAPLRSNTEVACNLCAHPVLLHGSEGCGMVECNCEMEPKAELWMRHLAQNTLWVYSGERWMDVGGAKESQFALPLPLSQESWQLGIIPGSLTPDNVLGCLMCDGEVRLIVVTAATTNYDARLTATTMRFSATLVSFVKIKAIAGSSSYQGHRLIELVGTYTLRREPIEVAPHVFRDEQLHPELS